MSKWIFQQASRRAVFALTLFACLHATAQNPATPAQSPNQSAAQTAGSQATGQKDSPKTSEKNGQDDKSATKPASAGEESASTTRLKLGPLDPSTPPKDIPHNRPVIGVAMGGGGALGLSEIGVLPVVRGAPHPRR